MIRQLIIGIFAGSFYGFLGYLKNNERFSFKKFSKSFLQTDKNDYLTNPHHFLGGNHLDLKRKRLNII